MSQHALAGAQQPRFFTPLRGRDPAEDGRAATPLELFFDLVVVVAVALAAEHLHLAYLAGFGLQTLIGYAMVFFGVWWAWANFSWFASAYDTDDVVFRIGVFVVMTGALVLAAGVASGVRPTGLHARCHRLRDHAHRARRAMDPRVVRRSAPGGDS